MKMMLSSRSGKWIVLGIIVGIAISLVACGKAEAVKTAVSLKPTIQASPSPGFITSTPFPPSTDTPIPSPSFTPSFTPTSTHTPTPTETPEPSIRFAVIGDYGLAGTAEADVAALVKSWSPDFIVTTGDNNYPFGSAKTIDENIGQYYHGFIYPYYGKYGEGADINRFFPSIGNHDWKTDEGQPYLDYFTLPGNERYYDFTWGPVQFFSINSDSNEPDGVNSSSVQAAWLQQNLASSISTWQIVYTHYAPYSSGTTHGSTGWIQWPFKEWGADAVLAGHEHIYERLIVDNLVYFVNGVGGATRYSFGEPEVGSMLRFRSDWGAMLVEASRQKIVFQFFTRKHELIDEYTLWAEGH